MPVTQETVIDQIETLRDGSVRIRYAKQFVDETGNVVGQVPPPDGPYHRSALFAPGVDYVDVLINMNESLVRDLKCPPISVEEMARVDKTIAREHVDAFDRTIAEWEAGQAAADMSIVVK